MSPVSPWNSWSGEKLENLHTHQFWTGVRKVACVNFEANGRSNSVDARRLWCNRLFDATKFSREFHECIRRQRNAQICRKFVPGEFFRPSLITVLLKKSLIKVNHIEVHLCDLLSGMLRTWSFPDNGSFRDLDLHTLKHRYKDPIVQILEWSDFPVYRPATNLLDQLK